MLPDLLSVDSPERVSHHVEKTHHRLVDQARLILRNLQEMDQHNHVVHLLEVIDASVCRLLLPAVLSGRTDGVDFDDRIVAATEGGLSPRLVTVPG